jgi:uridine kinase
MRYFVLFCLSFYSLFAQSKVIVGIGGGTGSGKTTLAEQIQSAFPNNSIIISQDAYYKSLTHLTQEERDNVNFDHPNALDFSLLRQNLIDLKSGHQVEQPIYNFAIHDRELQTRSIESKEIIIVEGILLFAVPEVRELFDLKIYVDTGSDVRILRRMERDIRERGRNVTNVKEQYLTTVKPMHDLFVEPSKKFADLIVPGEKYNPIALSMIISKIENDLK